MLQDGFDIGILLISGLAWFLISVQQERGRKIREDLEMLPLLLRWLLYLALIFTVILFGRYGQQYDAGAFMYQGF